jgi:hypothetical protein
MITFIIPTLWKSEMILSTIEQFKLIEDDSIELLIIDNLNSDYTTEDKRIIVHKAKKNIFVNPAWNLGVALSNNEYVCLLNDDITFNMKLFYDSFKKLVVEPELDFGIIAINAEGFRFQQINNDEDQITLNKLNIKGAGFGMFMIMKKEHYEMINPKLKVFFGDDIQWFVHYSIFRRDNYYFDDLKFNGEFSVTSREISEDITNEEMKIWENEVNVLINKYRS